MKRVGRGWVAVFMVFVMVMALAGCGVKQQAAETKKADVKWPTKDITVVVPWNPGGGTDLTVRALTTEMSKTLGVNIAVVNTPQGPMARLVQKTSGMRNMTDTRFWAPD